jgi:predicted ATP-binding protein involved in virulence
MRVDFMSDGIRSMLAMVGDIAYRCIKLNPHMGAQAAAELRFGLAEYVGCL